MAPCREAAKAEQAEQMTDVQAVGGRVETAIQRDRPVIEPRREGGPVGDIVDEPTSIEFVQERIGRRHPSIVAFGTSPTRLGRPDAGCNDGAMATDVHHDHVPNKWALGAGIGFFVLMAMFWIAIFSGAFTHRNPDKLYDEAWVAQAEKICAPAAHTIKNLPNASTSKTPADRSKLLDRGTVALDSMLDQLDALPTPTRDSDQTVVSGFLADWKIYIQDRRNFAQALLTDAQAQPLMTEVHGGWASDAIDAMASANDIPDCATPDDM